MAYTNTYIDTRGATDGRTTFTQAIIRGIASGGGLFVPKVLPRLPLDTILEFARKPYAQGATAIFRAFGVDLPSQTIDACMEAAYATNFDTPAIAPVRSLDATTHILELFHGPTLAFKDMALQCMPRFFSASLSALRAADAPEAKEDFLILVATSGDTGKAALEGFADREHTSITVYYPYEGVSSLQQAQMLTTQGSNVCVYGLRGNFDTCQTAVKQAFGDAAFAEQLARDHHLRLSSANSINWGRLLPQVVYYVNAYAQMVASGAIAAGEPIDVCVPTGNFGNILAAWYAAECGTPIERLLCASNTNRVLADFINTGIYDIREREFVTTPSPSMDILVSSNLERQLFELNGRNAEEIRTWMRALHEEQRFTVSRPTFAALRERFSADWVSVDESLDTIREVYATHHYLLDPHTAVGYAVAERLRGPNPVLLAATAHWSKFGADVCRGLVGIQAGEPLPSELAGLDGFALIRYIAAHYEYAGEVPPRMAELEGKEQRFGEVFEANVEAVEASVEEFLRNIGR
ncbi:MAG: threonine synthase [Coriobacteriales bacterium]|jgi:threonine synthase|nr:threonine synthase [Coriobacteriales bacterium]